MYTTNRFGIAGSPKDFSTTWLEALSSLLAFGAKVSPRGASTLEYPHATWCVDSRRPVLRVPERKLSYQFMVAEAFWILTGDNRVATIAPFNRRISDFSDDGETFFGAYGPRIADQLPYVICKLVADPCTRQAGLTIWRENPPPTKDVPCTVAVFFSIRDKKLHGHVFMRSSDVWLGIPYDVFNFSMLIHYVCALYNNAVVVGDQVEPGLLYLTAASSHLYDSNYEAAQQLTRLPNATLPQPRTPPALYTDPAVLLNQLKILRTSKLGDYLRWWEREQ